MNVKRPAKPKWTAADRARHKAVRKEFEECPTQEELEASGAYEGPIKSGAYFAVKVLIHELKGARETAGLTLAAVSKLTGISGDSQPAGEWPPAKSDRRHALALCSCCGPATRA